MRADQPAPPADRACLPFLVIVMIESYNARASESAEMLHRAAGGKHAS